MIHVWLELALWMMAFYFAGCPLGALARRLWDGWRGRLSGGA